jgi:hypothetical protein
MLRMPDADTRIFTQRPVASSKNRLVRRLGICRIFVLRFECETLLPTSGFFPVIVQTLDISHVGLPNFEAESMFKISLRAFRLAVLK